MLEPADDTHAGPAGRARGRHRPAGGLGAGPRDPDLPARPRRVHHRDDPLLGAEGVRPRHPAGRERLGRVRHPHAGADLPPAGRRARAAATRWPSPGGSGCRRRSSSTARSLLSPETVQTEELLAEVQRERRAAEAAKRDARREAAEADKLRRRLRDEVRRTEQERAEILRQARAGVRGDAGRAAPRGRPPPARAVGGRRRASAPARGRRGGPEPRSPDPTDARRRSPSRRSRSCRPISGRPRSGSAPR